MHRETTQQTSTSQDTSDKKRSDRPEDYEDRCLAGSNATQVQNAVENCRVDHECTCVRRGGGGLPSKAHSLLRKYVSLLNQTATGR
jgi:hypothetical protein